MTHDGRDVHSQKCQRLVERPAYEYSKMDSCRRWQETPTDQATLLGRRREDAGKAY